MNKKLMYFLGFFFAGLVFLTIGPLLKLLAYTVLGGLLIVISCVVPFAIFIKEDLN